MHTAMAHRTATAPPASGTEPLVGRYRRSEPGALEELIALHQHRVRQLAYRLTGWNEDLDDIVQDVFVKVFENLPRFREKCRLETWIFRITVNVCRSRQRRQQTQLFHLARQTPAQRTGATAEEELARSETSLAVRNIVQQLPEKYRAVIVLRYLEELEIPEIADVLRVRTNTVHVRLSRGRERLRKLLSTHKEFNGDNRPPESPA